MRGILTTNRQEAIHLKREFTKADRAIEWFGILAIANMAMIFYPWWIVLSIATTAAWLVHCYIVYRLKKLPSVADSLISIRFDTAQHLIGLTLTVLSFLFFPTFAKSYVPKWFTIVFFIGTAGLIYRDYVIRRRTLS